MPIAGEFTAPTFIFEDDDDSEEEDLKTMAYDDVRGALDDYTAGLVVEDHSSTNLSFESQAPLDAEPEPEFEEEPESEQPARSPDP